MTAESTLRKKVADWLVPYIGIKEGSTEHKEILAVYNDSKLCTRYTMTVNDAWCATAVSAAFISCGLSSIFPCVECSCANMITLAKAAGIWVEDDSHVPSVGDVILYDWQDSGSGDNAGAPDHVGIVTKVSGSAITVIEGNKSDTVGYRTITVNGQYIRGYITPNYAGAATDTDSSGASAAGNTILSAGAKLVLSGAKIYKTAGASVATGTKTGVFYIWSSIVVNGRIRITNSAARVGMAGQVTGWIAESDALASVSADTASTPTTFEIGDKVTVIGTIYGTGNGTGGSITKTGATMYVVNLTDSSKYAHYIGVSARKGGTRQGWAKPSILTKA